MRRGIWVGALLMVLLGTAGCQDDGQDLQTCTDADGDTYGPFCTPGPDCDDGDPNNWDSCSSCVDVDGDASFVGCDAFATGVRVNDDRVSSRDHTHRVPSDCG